MPLFEPDLPANVIVVHTDDLDLLKPDDSETLFRRMLDVPLDKSILLDYLIGRKPESRTTAKNTPNGIAS